MTYSSTVRVPTAKGSTMQAHDDGLECRLEASADGQLKALKGAVARHIDRFAFREAPLAFDWKDSLNG